MRDLTQGSITGHLLNLAAFMAISLIFQTFYFLIDLYFVSRLGSEAVAGVSAAGNIFFLALAAAQLVSIGAMALVAQAVGKKDEAEANLFSDQSLSMSLLFTLAMLVIGYGFGGAAVNALAADAAAAEHGRAFLYAYIPALAIMFPSYTMTSALRGTGVVMPTTILQVVGLILNAALAPVLIAGWGTGVPLGAAGAGLASSITAVIGIVALVFIFPRVQSYLRLHVDRLAPKWHAWRRILFIGLPTSLEFLMMFVIFVVVYWVIRGFGADAQAGFGIGARIMQSIFLPAMAVAFSAAPIAGQNYGARRHDRVRETFRQTALISSGIMLTLSLLCQLRPDLLATPFTSDRDVLAVTSEYLRITSWVFVLSGLVMTASSMFQGMGDTRPSLLASATKLLTFAAPAVWLSYQPFAQLHHVWLLNMASTFIQCALVLWLLLYTFRRKLAPTNAPAPVAASAE